MVELVSKNLSYSLIKSFSEEGPSVLITRTNKFTKSLDYGTKLDDFISLTKDQFNEKYLVVQNNNIKGDLFTLAQLVAKQNFKPANTEELVLMLQNKILQIISDNQLFKRMKIRESIIKKFHHSEFYKFVTFCHNNPNKIFISPEEYRKLIAAQSSLFTHKSTKKYFNCENCEELYQVEVNFHYKGRNIKCILDKVIIDHKNKTIQGLDLKSGSPKATEFMINFFKYKYYMQGAIYEKALREFVLTFENLEGYKIEPFKYIYIPTNDIDNSKVFILTQKWINAAWNGFTTLSGYRYKGMNELIDEINWHIENQVFSESKDFYNNPEIELNDDFISLT